MPEMKPPVDDIPQNISINGIDYSQEDAQSLIELGKKTKDLETKWSTPVDNVWPEYGKTREELKSIQAERDQYKAKIAEFESKQNAGVETQTDVKEAREAARKLGIVLDEDLSKQGYIKKDDLPALFKTYTDEQEGIRQVMSTADSLEKEIDGHDGRPSFNKRAVLAYASAYGIPDLKGAYEDMNKVQLDKWKDAQVNSQRNKGLKTLNGGGLKDVKATKVTDDNVNDLLNETLYGESNS